MKQVICWIGLKYQPYKELTVNATVLIYHFLIILQHDKLQFSHIKLSVSAALKHYIVQLMIFL